MEIRPIPKTYPGVTIKGLKNEIGFNYEAFMQSFSYTPQTKEVLKEVVVHKKDITEFTVVKKKMIIIQEKEYTLDMCGINPPPYSDETFFMNNRKIFLVKVRDMVSEYTPLTDISCDNMKATSIDLLPHQKLVRSYLNIRTPYRGLLLYHGLGSGKTCSSIAIAEGLKSYKNVVVMTPKSLEMNFLQELKKCGDPLYKINQTWEWVSPTDEQLKERCLTRDDLIRRQGSKGIWVHGKQPYDSFPEEDQRSIKKQIDTMIHKKYRFIHYNGLTINNIKQYTQGNPFSNNVLIVDEAHNWVTKIVNVLRKKRMDHPSLQLYHLIMDAENCKVVMLTGTPMINHAYEISVLFNMIRGYIHTWSCNVTGVSEEEIKKEFPDIDTIQRKMNTLTVTRCPHGFTRAESTDVQRTNYEEPFETRITRFFKRYDCEPVHQKYTALPDNEDEFNALFMKDSSLHNKYMLMSRIAGLSSFFPDVTQLMPTLKPPLIHHIPMSTQQYDEYVYARLEELGKEKVKKKDKDEKFQGTYRIKTRLICNTIYPLSAKKHRPENLRAEVLNEENEEEEVRGVAEFFKAIDASDYCTQIQIYSPKYDEMMHVIQSKQGLQLLYSQFLNIEGIKLFSKVLECRGFTEFDVKQVAGTWTLNVPPEKRNRPMYIIYGGTKTPDDKKELFRNVFNRNEAIVPAELWDEVKDLDIPLFMITSSGAEGISLRNVQYVHIMEPYWNPVRNEQVIGRARRICSHNTLPEKDRFVEVHLYLSVFPDVSIAEGLKKDVLKNGKVGTTDEYMYALSEQKRTISNEVLNCIRKASIDCSLYGDDCLSLPTNNEESLLYVPDIKDDVTKDTDIALNMTKKYKTIAYPPGNVVFKFDSSSTEDLIPVYKHKDDTLVGYINGKTLYDLDKKKTDIKMLIKSTE